jgi:Arylsulfotransferase (ASST)
VRKPLALVGALATLLTIGLAPAAVSRAEATPPTQSLSASGTGVAMYPAFDPTIHRYGVTTTASTAGTVTVTASTTDPAGTVWVDGQPAANGAATLTGLTDGAEISVFIKDAAGSAVYSLVYLPVGFPTVNVTTDKPGISPGDVFLGITDFTGTTPSYNTAVDTNGVPAYVTTESKVPLNFMPLPDGDYSMLGGPHAAGQTGTQLVVFNKAYQQIATYHTIGLGNTDGHDGFIDTHGNIWLIDIENNTVADTGPKDDIIQEQSPQGKVLFQWDSAKYLEPAETVEPPSSPDYAHLNSISLMSNGDLLASFRDMDQIVEIATSAHNGFKVGDIVWRLGGRNSTFQFAADDGGPCAQHDASQLPNGDILLFDDGSEDINGSPLLCINPADRSGPTIARPQSRVDEYSLNQTTHVATLAWSYQSADNREGVFGGSAQRLPNGNTLIGWGGGPTTLATEVDSSRNVVWELQGKQPLLSYRALKGPAPDAIAPVINLIVPATAAEYAQGQQVPMTFSCTDRGGSSLQSCGGAAVEGGPLNTSTLGVHTITVVAKDGAGNTTTLTRSYLVGHYQPDAMIRASTAHAFVGGNEYGGFGKQDIDQAITRKAKSASAIVHLQNDGDRSDRLMVRATTGTKRFTVSYFADSLNVTKRVDAGTYRTPSLGAGKTFALKVTIKRTTKTPSGTTKTIKLVATSTHAPTLTDTVATLVTARG